MRERSESSSYRAVTGAGCVGPIASVSSVGVMRLPRVRSTARFKLREIIDKHRREHKDGADNGGKRFFVPGLAATDCSGSFLWHESLLFVYIICFT